MKTILLAIFVAAISMTALAQDTVATVPAASGVPNAPLTPVPPNYYGRYFVCYASNYYGQQFWARDWNYWRARNNAIGVCQYYSYSYCYFQGCQQYW